MMISLLDLDISLKPLVGCMSWGVTYGITNLSIEFGTPSIRVIHEPERNIQSLRKSRNVPPKEICRRASRRQVSVNGSWTLWVYCANWRIVRSGVCIASTCSTMGKISAALMDLQGQKIVSANINKQNGGTQFEFDLDTVLEVRRKCRFSKDELWLLYGFDGYKRLVYGNGTFRRHPYDRAGEFRGSSGHGKFGGQGSSGDTGKFGGHST